MTHRQTTVIRRMPAHQHWPQAQPPSVVVQAVRVHRTVIGFVVSENGCFLPFRYKSAPPGFPNCSVIDFRRVHALLRMPAEAPMSPWKIWYLVEEVSLTQVTPP